MFLLISNRINVLVHLCYGALMQQQYRVPWQAESEVMLAIYELGSTSGRK